MFVRKYDCISQKSTLNIYHFNYLLLYKKKYPVDFDDELKIGDIRY